MRLVLLATLVLAAACASSEAVESTEDAIVNGQISTSEQDAVVRLVIGDANGEVCTGTLIAPNAVLTARHCFAKRNRDLPKVVCRVEGSAAGVVAETTPDFPYVGNVDVRSTVVSAGRDLEHPTFEAHGVELFTDNASTMCEHDIAIVLLDRRLPITPRKVRAEKPVLGERVTAVGWGFTNQTSSTGAPVLPNNRMQRTDIAILGGEKDVVQYRRQNGQIIPSGAMQGELIVGESVCNGDSGGPLFDANGMILGVTSRRVSNLSVRCVDSPAVFSHPGSSQHHAVISAALARASEITALSSP